MFRNLGVAVGFSRPVTAQAAAQTDVTGASYDLQGSFGGMYAGICYVMSMNTLSAGHNCSIKVQGSNDNSTWVDIATSQQGPAQTTDSGNLLIVDVFRPEFRYVRPYVIRTGGTGNAAIDGVTGIAYLAHSMPVATQDATVSVPTSSHASTTPVPVNIVAYGAAGTA